VNSPVARLLVVVVVLGVVWWLLTFLALPEPFHTLARIVVVVCLIWEVLAVAGMTGSIFNRRQ
jgi:hypothetical protein